MTKLVLGVLLWSATHFVPAVAADFRKRVIDRIGENPYKGLFTLAMVFALYLIISGWRATLPEFLYVPPAWGRHAASLLVLIAFILFSASHGQNNIRRIVRHPQLTSVVVWGIAHLLANGESRSIVLFGGLALWALVEIVLLNRRGTFYYDLARALSLARIRASTTGDTDVEGKEAPGLSYDLGRRRLVAWAGGAAVWDLDTADFMWRKHMPPAGPAPEALNAQRRGPKSRGVHGRWRYVPSLDRFIGVNSTADNVWLYRAPAAAD